MTLAVMIGTDRDAVICDLAETYHILDYSVLPVALLATLCAGLREDSRIKMRLANLTEIPAVFSLVRAADALMVLVHGLSGKNSGPMPDLLGEIMAGKQKQTKKATAAFATPEEFEAAWQRLTEV